MNHDTCAICGDAVDPETAHTFHEPACPNRLNTSPTRICECSRLVHPQCCPSCAGGPTAAGAVGSNQGTGQKERATWLITQLHHRLSRRGDGTADLRLSAGMVGCLDDFVTDYEASNNPASPPDSTNGGNRRHEGVEQ
jgi:hypothetical protein